MCLIFTYVTTSLCIYLLKFVKGTIFLYLAHVVHTFFTINLLKMKKNFTVNNVKRAKLLINVGRVIPSALRFKLLVVALEK
jgi:hypothetical protein